ncbi:MAG: RIP metalloprotease RseP [Gemmatimonadales bacterium]
MNVLISIGSLLVVLGVLVFVHELGHFLAAKWAGIRVHRFALGMGSPIPRLSFRRGHTEYAICWLPLGGYVKMATREEEVTSSALEGGRIEEPVPESEMFESQPVWKRMIVILAGVTMNALFAVVAFSALAAINGKQIDPVTTVGSVLTDSLPPGAEALRALRAGDRIIAVGGQPMASWNDILTAFATTDGDSFSVDLADGRKLPVQIHPAALHERAQLMGAIEPEHPTVFDRVEAGRPAALAGVEVGDTLLSINGGPATSRAVILDLIRSSPGIPIQFRVGRASGQVDLTVTPDSVTEGDVVVGKVGLALVPAVDYQKLPYHGLEIPRAGLSATREATLTIFRTVQGLLSARISSSEVGGPIMIAQVAGQAARAGLDTFLNIMAVISLNLAVLNLLPVPVLDGGQFLFLLAEGILRRPLSLRLRERLTLVGLVLIVCLMVLAFKNDIARNWSTIVGFFQRLFGG